MLRSRLLLATLSLALVSPRLACGDDDAGVTFFETKIRPVLVEHCYECHSGSSKIVQGNLLLDSAAGIRKGGDSGAMLGEEKLDDSLLLAALAYTGEFVDMPPRGKLPDRILADFRRWVEMGAPLPKDQSTVQSTAREIDIEKGRTFWSFVPAVEHPQPPVSNPDWPRTRLDWFVLQNLDEHDLTPAPEADRRTLLRRIAMDLTGLPPTPEEVAEFEADPAVDAYERAVERFLASPAYGERWARHWLDIARYAEDNPTSEATCQPPRFPHPYRDWVIRALNDDLPYDEFIRRQLAADLRSDLPPAEVAATGFLGLSPVYHKEPKLSAEVISVIVADEWDERLDTITRGLLGLTVACARCHDHKFDPIRTQDYYALAGVLASTQLVEAPLVPLDEKQAAALTDVQLKLVDFNLRLSYAKAMRKTAAEEERPTEEFDAEVERYQAIVDDLKQQQKELFDGPICNAVRDAGCWVKGDDPDWTEIEFRPGESRDLPVFVRGSVTNHGEIVPRRFLEVLSSGEPRPFGSGSGRLELAEAIVTDAASLTARVIVNRVWGWRMGQPLVTTPSNFGALGDRPSHPELLDDLAARFMRNGWSLKWLHREMLLSATYRQASVVERTDAERRRLATLDPANRLLSRMNRVRLSPEVWRDAALSISGQLDRTIGGKSADLGELKNVRRSVYGKVSRQQPADLFALFDFPDAKRHGDQRVLTTTPLQQLYLLNSPFVQQQARRVSERVAEVEQVQAPREAVERIFQLILLRAPNEKEVRSALRLVAPDGATSAERMQLLAHSLFASNEFLFVD